MTKQAHSHVGHNGHNKQAQGQKSQLRPVTELLVYEKPV